LGSPPIMYPGLFNSSYIPSPLELHVIEHPVGQLGPILLADIFVSLLQGVMVVQYHNYVINYWNETRWTRWIVHTAFWLCTLKFAYVWWLCWNKLVAHHGDWFYLTLFTTITVPIGISTTIPTAVCQIFYIHRCWALSRNWLFLIPALLTLILTVGGGISLTVGSSWLSQGKLTSTKLNIVSADITLSAGLTCDIFITGFTCYHLLREKTGFKETDNLVVRLVKTSIESAAGPTIVALVNLVLSNLLATTDEWFLFPNLILAHVYACSLFYCVNARKDIDQAQIITRGLNSGSGSRIHTPRVASFSPWKKGDRSAPHNRAVSNPGVLVELHTIQIHHEDELMDTKNTGEHLIGTNNTPSSPDSNFKESEREIVHY